MEIPRFAEDGHRRSIAFQKRLQVRVVSGGDTRFTGGTECCYTRVVEGCVLSQVEKLHVPGIGTRPAALDVMDAKVVQALGNLDFFFGGKADVFPLGSVS